MFACMHVSSAPGVSTILTLYTIILYHIHSYSITSIHTHSISIAWELVLCRSWQPVQAAKNRSSQTIGSLAEARATVNAISCIQLLSLLSVSARSYTRTKILQTASNSKFPLTHASSWKETPQWEQTVLKCLENWGPKNWDSEVWTLSSAQ